MTWQLSQQGTRLHYRDTLASTLNATHDWALCGAVLDPARTAAEDTSEVAKCKLCMRSAPPGEVDISAT